ncbi:MAG: DUF4112 domain-containing protein [Bacteroidota bacterium]
MDQTTKAPIPELWGIDKFSELLDSKFRIPGTNVRFGIDFLIGLFPYVGDILGFLFSAGLVITIARHGASGQLVARMILNVLLDTVIGSIPLIGDLFDLAYKANRRNYNLLVEHYGEGEHQGSVWKVIIPILLVLLILLILLIILLTKFVTWSIGLLLQIQDVVH